MKVALVGTAPSSMQKAPFGDPSWLVWGCSPGLYAFAGRIDAWYEVHRFEPGIVGKPQTQVPWFSPEYVQWMGQLQCPVWMREPVPEIPRSQRLPWEQLVAKYGHFFFTSSLAWMAAMAIEAILGERKVRAGDDKYCPPAVREAIIARPATKDVIGFFGVDMAANEEYGYQRAGCQFFGQMAASLGIEVFTPPESDLMIPPALYGISEGTHRHIKLTARKNELVTRKQQLEANLANMQANLNHVNGALDDMSYHMGMWLHEGDIKGTNFEEIFPASRVAEVAANDGVQHG